MSPVALPEIPNTDRTTDRVTEMTELEWLTYCQDYIRTQAGASEDYTIGAQVTLPFTVVRPVMNHLMQHDLGHEAQVLQSQFGEFLDEGKFGFFSVDKTFAHRLVELSERAVTNQAKGVVEQDTPENRMPPRRSAVMPLTS